MSKLDTIVTEPAREMTLFCWTNMTMLKKMMDIISDTSIFNLVQKDISSVMLNWHITIQIVNKWRNNKRYRNLYAKGSVPGIMYGLPKVHMDGIPIRPKLSAIETWLPISQVPSSNLTPLSTNIFTLSFTFTKEMATISFEKCCMPSAIIN